MIDHYIFDDDSNSAKLGGVWTTVFLETKRLRTIQVSLFRKRNFPDLENIKKFGEMDQLPDYVKTRLDIAAELRKN